MGIDLPKELFVLANNLELGEAIGQGSAALQYRFSVYRFIQESLGLFTRLT